MGLRCVLDGNQVLADAAQMAQRRDGFRAILKQGFSEDRIGPGFRHHAGAVVRADAGLVGLDDGVQGGRIAAMNQMIPLGRGGLPEEAAGSVYLFCSPDSDYVSGQCLVVNGGL